MLQQFLDDYASLGTPVKQQGDKTNSDCQNDNGTVKPTQNWSDTGDSESPQAKGLSQNTVLDNSFWKIILEAVTAMEH